MVWYIFPKKVRSHSIECEQISLIKFYKLNYISGKMTYGSLYQRSCLIFQKYLTHFQQEAVEINL